MTLGSGESHARNACRQFGPQFWRRESADGPTGLTVLAGHIRSSFSSLRDLPNQMAARGGLRGAVTRIGIVAHGDEQGVVKLDTKITIDTLDKVNRELQELRLFLTKDGMLEFYSCVAGAGAEGSQLLCAISQRLPGRSIVGFTIMGETDASENLSAVSAQSPGRIREAPHGKNTGRRGMEGLMTPCGTPRP